MYKSFSILILTIISLQVLAQKPEPTIAKRIDSVRVLHNDTTHDFYGWMHGKYNRELINHLYAENAYADRVMKDSWLLQKRLYEEQRAQIKDVLKTDSTLYKGYWYYSRYEKDKDYGIECRRADTLNSSEQIYFDGNKLAEKYSYFSINTFKISPNQKLLAYGINNDGSDKGYLFIKDIDNDTLLKEEIERVSNFVWVNDSVFIYTVEDKKSHKPERMYRHTIGYDVKTDSLIWYEPSKALFFGLGKSSSKEYIFVTLSGMRSGEIYYAKTENPYGKFTLFQKMVSGKTYNVNHYKGDNSFYIRTNIGNDNGKLMQCPIDKTNIENWKDLINIKPPLIYGGTSILKNYFITQISENGLNRIIIHNRTTGEEKTISVEGENYVLNSGGAKYDSLKIKYYYSSLVQPTITH